MTMLPDVPEDEYRQYLSDQFSKGATDQINALSDPPPTPHSEFMAADEAQAAPAPTPAAPTPPPADSPAPSGPTPIRFRAAPPDTGFRSPGVVPSTTFLPADSAASPILSNASPPDTGFRSPPVMFLPDDSSSPSATPSALPPGASSTVSPGGDLQSYARAAALQAGIDPDIFVRQIQQESGFNPTAKSGAGALGIAQFMPGTAAGLGVDPSDPYASLDAAARMDAQHLKQYGGDWSRTLAAYNAGPGAVEKYGGVPPFEETQRYVSNILQGQDASKAVTPA